MDPVSIPIQYVRQRVGRPKKYFTEEDVREMRRANSEKNYKEHPEKKIEQQRKYRIGNLEKIKAKAADVYQQKKEQQNAM